VTFSLENSHIDNSNVQTQIPLPLANERAVSAVVIHILRPTEVAHTGSLGGATLPLTFAAPTRNLSGSRHCLFVPSQRADGMSVVEFDA
jgi:hypothetical protein